jgi:hypothetical protein
VTKPPPHLLIETRGGENKILELFRGILVRVPRRCGPGRKQTPFGDAPGDRLAIQIRDAIEKGEIQYE